MKRQLIYKVYPLLLWTLCLAFFVAGVAIAVALQARWTFFVWPIPAAVLGYIVTSICVSRFPRIRFVSEAEADGLGFVHEPMETLVSFLLTAFPLAAILAMWLGR